MAQGGWNVAGELAGLATDRVTLTDLFCGEADDELEEKEEEEESEAEKLHHQPNVQHAGKGIKTLKRPHYVEPTPDLDEYFREFDLSNLERIKICRTYASYLTELEPSLKRKRAKKQRSSPSVGAEAKK